MLIKRFQSFALDFASAGVRLEGVSEIIERIPNRKMVTVSKKGAESKFIWTYEQEGEGTRMTVEAKYIIPVPVLGNLAASVIAKNNEHQANIMIANLKTTM